MLFFRVLGDLELFLNASKPVKIGNEDNKKWQVNVSEGHQILTHLDPYIVEKPWGGTALQKRRPGISGKIGETWEISTVAGHETKVQSTDLSKVLGKRLPYLMKFINTTDLLSVQVHPNDQYAQENEKTSGKTECWIILDSNPDAFLYLGFKEGIGREEFKKSIATGTPLDCLRKIPVQEGDFFFVPAGTVHAIGAGITLCEIQQASGVTYRVWDYNRPGNDGQPRELHLDKAFDVLNFDESFQAQVVELSRNKVFQKKGINFLCEHPQFRVKVIELKKDESFEYSPQGILFLTNLGDHEARFLINDEEFLLASRDSVIMKNFSFINLTLLSGDSSRLLVVDE